MHSVQLHLYIIVHETVSMYPDKIILMEMCYIVLRVFQEYET